jgi:glycosyltransferase involved in cell wall biosynthesis
MACGVPVASTDCPSGPRELLLNGEAGILVPVNSPDLLAEAILEVLVEDEINKDLRQKGLKRAQEFAIEHVADQFIAMVSRLINGNV